MISIFFSQGRFGEVDPGFLRDWLIVAACIVGLVIAVMTMVEKLKAKQPSKVSVSPDPLQVKEVKELATRSEMVAMERRLTEKISAVEGDIDKEQKVAREEQGKLHARIDKLTEGVAETKGILEGVKENTDLLLARSLR